MRNVYVLTSFTCNGVKYQEMLFPTIEVAAGESEPGTMLNSDATTSVRVRSLPISVRSSWSKICWKMALMLPAPP